MNRVSEVRAREFVELFNRGDIDTLAELYSADALLHVAPDVNVKGQKNIKNHWIEARSDMPRARAEMFWIISDGNRAAFQLGVSGTVLQPLLMPGMTILAPNSKMQLRAVHVITETKGFIESHRVFADVLEAQTPSDLDLTYATTAYRI